MRRYSNRLLSTSTIKGLAEFKTFILGTLPMLLTVTDLNSRKTFISLSECLYYTCSYNNKTYIVASFYILQGVHVQSLYALPRTYRTERKSFFNFLFKFASRSHYVKVWGHAVWCVGTIKQSCKHSKDYRCTYRRLMENKDKKNIIRLLRLQQIHGSVLVLLSHHCSIVG